MDVPQTKSSKMLHVQELSSQLQLSHSNSVTLVHKLRNRGGGGEEVPGRKVRGTSCIIKGLKILTSSNLEI